MTTVINKNTIVKDNTSGKLFYQYRGTGSKVFLQAIETGENIEVRTPDFWKNYTKVSYKGIPWDQL